MKTNTVQETEIIDIEKQFGMLYHPQSALVFYQSKNPNSEPYVEYFDMDENGSPINAQPLSVREAKNLSQSLQIQTEKEKSFLKPKGVLPTNVLYLDSSDNGKMIWFSKAQERELFFVKNLGIPNGKANVPSLLWCADKFGLKIFALKSSKRPNENTPLFHAPFFNIYEDGKVCMGTVDVRIKKSLSLEEFIESWEEYFFNSYFSHLMIGHNPTQGNCLQVWKDLIQNKTSFPTDILIDSKLTLRNLL